MKNLTFLCCLLLTACGMNIAASAAETEPETGWQQRGKRYYYIQEDGIPASGETEIDGVTYLFAPNGALQTGWQTVGDKRFYYESDGTPVFGWMEWRGERYYISKEQGKLTAEDAERRQFDACGVLLHDQWMQHEDGWMYLTEDGLPADGAYQIDGQTYVFDADGILQTGWQTDEDGCTRYYTEERDILTGWQTLDGARYFLDAETGRVSGSAEIDGMTCFFDADGVLLRYMQDGFGYDADGQPLDGIYAFGTHISERFGFRSGEMLTGEQVYPEGIRDFGTDGRMKVGWDIEWDYYPERNTDWSEDSARRRRYNYETGLRVTGWYNINTDEYAAGIQDNPTHYFDPESGEAVHGVREIDGKRHYFVYGELIRSCIEHAAPNVYYLLDENGEIQTGLQKYQTETYYFEPDGKMHFGWLDAGDHQKRFFIDTQDILSTEHYGAMVVDAVRVIDGKEYRFDENGICTVPIKICLDAGHYGKYNPSPVNSAYWESDFNWKMHLYLKEELEQYGFEVMTTREDKETDIYVEDRGRLAEGCDLFISIHSNAVSDSTIDGPLACRPINGCTDELGLKLANLVADVMETKQRGSIWKREGLRGDWYGVLRGATAVGVPAILLEHSYHTNPRATAWLLVDENVRKMAKAEAEFLAEWYGMLPPEKSEGE